MARRSTGQVLARDTKAGVVYALRFRAYGERQYVTLGSKAEGWTRKRAEDQLRHVRADVDRGTWVSPAMEQEREDAERARLAAETAAHTPFDDFARQWLDSVTIGARPATIRAYRFEIDHLVAAFGSTSLPLVRARDVDAMRDRLLRDGLSPTYVNTVLGKLFSIYKRAVRYELVDRNPVEDVERAKGERFRRAYLDSVEQARALLDAAGALDQEARDDRRHVGRKAMVATMLFGGLRVSEAAALRWRDVDLTRGTLKVAESKTEAGRRTVDLLPALAAELRSWKAAQPDERRLGDAYVFATTTGARPGKDNVAKRIVRPAVDRANERLGEHDQLGDVTPHGLRVTFASMLVEVGESPVYVAAQMGHEDAKTTLGIYARVLARHRRDPAAWRALMGTEPVSGTGMGTKPAAALLSDLR